MGWLPLMLYHQNEKKRGDDQALNQGFFRGLWGVAKMGLAKFGCILNMKVLYIYIILLILSNLLEPIIKI